MFVHVFFHVFPLSKKLSSKGKSKSLRASWMLLTCTWQELATSITGRLVPGHPGHPGHPKQWDAVKDLPKWDRCWDWCWDGLELKYTWNILKRWFLLWIMVILVLFERSCKLICEKSVNTQDGWELLDDCSWSNDANDASINVSYVFPSFQSWTSLKIPTLIKHGWKTSRLVRWLKTLHFSIYRGSQLAVFPLRKKKNELCRTHLGGATGLKTCLLLRSAAVTSSKWSSTVILDREIGRVLYSGQWKVFSYTITHYHEYWIELIRIKEKKRDI